MNKKKQIEADLIQEKIDKIGAEMDDLDNQINEAASEEIEHELTLKFIDLLNEYLKESENMKNFLYLDRLK